MARDPYALVMVWADDRETYVMTGHNPVEVRAAESRVARDGRAVLRIELRDLTGVLETIWKKEWDHA